MKLDNNNNNNNNNNKNNKDQMSSNQNIKREKSADLTREAKEKLKQEKLLKEKEKKEKKEAEKRLEKEKKEREKQLKLNNKNNQQQVSSSATTSDLNKIESNLNSIPLSKSENVLNKLKKQTSLLTSSSSNNSNKKPSLQQMQQQQQQIPKGRFRCQVVYLDESVKTFDLDKNAIGDDLVTLVCTDLELVEKEYFSLTYRDVNNMKFWIDHEKKIRSQLKGSISTTEPVFNFEVKFYPPEPNVLQEEITRYLLTLQLRHDIMDGKLPCTFVTHALLGSYTVQAEMGDYDEINSTNSRINVNGLSGFEYLDGFCFAPNQTPDLLAAIAECHKDHKGQSPAEAEMHFLENAVKLSMYGVDLHNAKDSDGVDILIGVSATGLLVFRDHLRINRFAWPKILKISYKRNHFYLKLRPGEFEKYETTIGFRCPNHKSAKRLWKIAVEHHAFFRLREPEDKKSRIIPNFNSKFRYTGSSTYMQSRHRSIERSQPPFTRSLSKRLTQSMDRGLALQNPNDTPSSIQSAMFNNFNRSKPVSVSNINKQNYNIRESQEDLEQGADYVLNENDNINNRNNFNSYQNQYQPSAQQQLQQQQQQQLTPRNSQQPTVQLNNINNLPKLNSTLLERITRDAANLSNRSNNTNQNISTPSNSYKPNATNKLNNLPLVDNQSREQLEDYYTSVDKNFTEKPDEENRIPSIKQSLAESIANMSIANKISTPVLNPSVQTQAQNNSQRYVPARQISGNNQVQLKQNDEFDASTPTSKIPVSPRYNLNSISSNKQNNDKQILDSNSNFDKPNPFIKNSFLSETNLKISPIQSKKQIPKTDSVDAKLVKNELNVFGSQKFNMYQNIKPIDENNDSIGDEYFERFKQINKYETDKYKRVEEIDQILSKNVEKKIEKNYYQIADSEPVQYGKVPLFKPPPQPLQTNQSPINSERFVNQTIQSGSIRSVDQQAPQPITRGRQPPPPVPADRSSVNRPNDSSRFQQQIEQTDQINIPKFPRQQLPNSQQSSMRQATGSASSFGVRINETSKTGSITSTPEVNRVKRQIVVNEEVNNKELLLRAIQMATELDPMFEVDKVEITTED